MKTRRFKPEELSVEEPLINLTPLIDVVFIVLITFMIIAPILQTDHIELATGHAKLSQSSEYSHLPIQVRQDNTIWLKGQCISKKSLAKKLAEEKRSNPHFVPQLIQDQRASFGTYQTVKNILETCGFTEMDVVLSPS